MIRHIALILISATNITGICQDISDDTTKYTGGYYVVIFNSQAIETRNEISSPNQGDYYKLDYTKQSVWSINDESVRFTEGENISLMSKDSLIKYKILDPSSVSVIFMKSDKGCWLKTTGLESKLTGDTLNITRIALSSLHVKYERKQACENDPLPIIPTLSDNIDEIEFTSPDGLTVDRHSGGIMPSNQPAGTYSIRYTSNFCLDNVKDTITIVSRPEFTIEKNRRICEGNSLELTPEAISNAAFSWSTGAVTRSISVSSVGEYAITAENEFGCRHTDTVNVELKTIHIEQIDYDVVDADCYNTGNIILKNLELANGLLPYKYNFKNRVTGNTVEDPSNLREGDYILSVEDADGCITSYHNMISIKKDCLNEYPVFSPNTDGMDDDYYIAFEGEAVVYDRNGIERHRFMAPDYWDGKDKNGNPLPLGTYVIVVGRKEVINITIIK